MTILVNDEAFELEREMTIEAFIAEELEGDGEFVVLLNDVVVSKEKWGSVVLKEGDSLEVARFVSGG